MMPPITTITSKLKGRWVIHIETVSICFIIFLIYSILSGTRTYYYDSKWYWTVADGMFQDGKFNLYGFPETFRGYFFPTLILFVKNLGALIFHSEFMGFWVFMSLIMAMTLGVSIPYLFQFRIDTYKMMLRLILCTVLVLYFWGDFLQYPLSDFPAVVFLIGGAALLRCALRLERWGQYVVGFLAGMCLYASYNTRAVFLFGALFVVIYYGVLYIRENRKSQEDMEEKRRQTTTTIILFISLLIGCAVAALPQTLINEYYTGEYTPRVLTEQYRDYNASLQEQQLLWGLTYSRYETYIGSEIHYPKAGVRYDDPIGAELITREGISLDNFSYGTMISLFLKYPLDICGIYARHLINLLTPIYAETYIHELFAPKLIRIVISILFWLCSAVYGIYRGKTITLRDGLLVIGLSLPAFLQLFGAPEIRFFLPVHLLLYCYLCFGIRWKELWGLIRTHPVWVLLPCIVIFFAWSTIISDTLQSCRYELQLISDSPKTYSVQEVLYSAREIEFPDTEQTLQTELFPLESGSLKSDTLYQISFRMTCSGEVPDLLYFDLYGTNYDNQAQNFTFDFRKGSHTYRAICNSGTVPEDAVLRVFYETETPYTIKDLQLTSVTSDR